MKKNLISLIIAFVLCFSVNAFSQTCQWAERISGTGNDGAKSSVIDNVGNIYVTGQFDSPTINFNNGISLTNSGESDAYIAKYNSAGICQWAEKIAGINADNGIGIVLDNMGSIYIIGDFNSTTLYFNNDITLSNGGNNDIFISKYNSSGVCQWAEKISSEWNEFSSSIAVDNLGNFFISGNYTGQYTINFNNGIVINPSGSAGGFIAKYNENGICQWAEQIAGQWTGHTNVHCINVDNDGNPFIVGDSWAPIVYFNNGITIQGNGIMDDVNAFLAKYNTNGVCQWAEKIDGNTFDYWLAYRVVIDDLNNIYVSGSFNSPSLIFNNGISLNNSGSKDAYLAKYNSNGVCQWAEKIAGTIDDFPYGLALDTNNNIYISGYYLSSVLNFNNGISIANNGEYDAFFTKYNTNGLCQWAENIAGNGSDYAYSIFVDETENILVCGNYFSSTISFNNSISLTNIGSGDGFIAKYTQLQISLNPPTLLAPLNNSSSIPTNPVLEWSSVENASSYTLQIATDADFENIIVDDTEIIDTSNQVNDLIIYTTYFWRVKAANNLVESPWSEVWNFTTIWGANEAEAIFAAGPNLNTARYGHHSASLEDGRLVVFGGHGNNFVSLGSAEVWDPANPNSFTTLNMNYTHDMPTFVELNDGRYLIAGGCSNLGVPAYATSEIFNPANNTFSPVGSMVRFRASGGGAELSNGNVLIASAWWTHNTAHTYGELLNQQTQTFSAVGPFSIARSLAIVMPTNDGQAVVLGGSTPTGANLPTNMPIELFNPENSSISTLQSSLFADEDGWHISTRTNYCKEQLMQDGCYLWMAGKSINNVGYRRLFTFDPETKTTAEFVTYPALPNSTIYSLSQPLVDYLRNTAHILAVVPGSGFPVCKVISVDLATGNLTISSNSYNFTYHYGTASVLSDGRIFITGGSSNGSNFNLVNNTTFITPPLYSNNKQYINLNAGWNTISANYFPDEPNMEDMFAEIEDLVILKNGDGQIFNPAQNINQIGDWNIAHGYMVYVTAPATLQITGTEVNPTETEINLVSGWNLISYLRNSPMAITTALAGISSSIILVKNNLGKLYYPAYGLNTLGNMQQGQGYWLYMNSNAVLVYPGN